MLSINDIQKGGEVGLLDFDWNFFSYDERQTLLNAVSETTYNTIFNSSDKCITKNTSNQNITIKCNGPTEISNKMYETCLMYNKDQTRCESIANCVINNITNDSVISIDQKCDFNETFVKTILEQVKNNLSDKFNESKLDELFDAVAVKIKAKVIGYSKNDLKMDVTNKVTDNFTVNIAREMLSSLAQFQEITIDVGSGSSINGISQKSSTTIIASILSKNNVVGDTSIGFEASGSHETDKGGGNSDVLKYMGIACVIICAILFLLSIMGSIGGTIYYLNKKSVKA